MPITLAACVPQTAKKTSFDFSGGFGNREVGTWNRSDELILVGERSADLGFVTHYTKPTVPQPHPFRSYGLLFDPTFLPPMINDTVELRIGTQSSMNTLPATQNTWYARRPQSFVLIVNLSQILPHTVVYVTPHPSNMSMTITLPHLESRPSQTSLVLLTLPLKGSAIMATETLDDLL